MAVAFMSTEQWTWQCEHRIPSHSREGRRVQEEILGELGRQHWPPHDVFGIHLAMEEALANAIKHGNRSDYGKSVCIRCRLSPDRVRIEVADEGPGFTVSSVPDPTDPVHIGSPFGRGILLMRSFMTRVEYNDRGNQVILEKRRSPAEGPSHEHDDDGGAVQGL
jgi:serine/threonine-protein kinase RsbW